MIVRFHITGDAAVVRDKLVSHYEGSLIFAGDPCSDLGDGVAFATGEWFSIRTYLLNKHAEYEMRAVDDDQGVLLEIHGQGLARDKYLRPHFSFLLRTLGLTFETS
jgi:hypothetical protein